MHLGLRVELIPKEYRVWQEILERRCRRDGAPVRHSLPWPAPTAAHLSYLGRQSPFALGSGHPAIRPRSPSARFTPAQRPSQATTHQHPPALYLSSAGAIISESPAHHVGVIGVGRVAGFACAPQPALLAIWCGAVAVLAPGHAGRLELANAL